MTDLTLPEVTDLDTDLRTDRDTDLHLPDYSGRENHATLTTGEITLLTHTTVTPLHSPVKSLQFDGRSAAVIPVGFNDNGYDDVTLTVEMWLSSRPNTGYLIVNRGGLAAVRIITTSLGTTCMIFLSPNMVTSRECPADLHTPHYYALTFDGQSVAMFADGYLLAVTEGRRHRAVFSDLRSHEWLIGRSGTWSRGDQEQQFQGNLFSLRITLGALTHHQIHASYLAGLQQEDDGSPASQTVPVAQKYIVPQAVYVGCYPNGEKEASSVLYKVPEMTPDICLMMCSTIGHLYAGIWSGVYCSCSQSLSVYTAPLSRAQCSLQCDGDSGETCGGERTTDLYHITQGSAVEVGKRHAETDGQMEYRVVNRGDTWTTTWTTTWTSSVFTTTLLAANLALVKFIIL